MKNRRSARTFRATLASDQELQAAATNPRTSVDDIWTAFIWRFLAQKVFLERAILDFYSSPGENATYYMRSINEIDYLMSKSNFYEFGNYARRLWKRQALYAISQSSLQARLARVITGGQDRAAGAGSCVITPAVMLNEYMMTEKNDIWSVDLDGNTGSDDDHFYIRLDDMELKLVSTAAVLRDNLPLDGIRSRLALDLIRQCLTKLCVVSPALRYQHIRPEGNGYRCPGDSGQTTRAGCFGRGGAAAT
ncbi:hypothetical protein diail_598 [Diaporthe ilicicola]|nr:hypothetical protein diail_598 [Diaporthe ilicicola]